VRVQLQPESEQLVLIVSDDGVGLPADLDLEHTESVGLQLVHDLAEQLHGTLVLSRDRGTTFRIAFKDPGADDFDL
jgi:two-component sensor histidine kinase